MAVLGKGGWKLFFFELKEVFFTEIGDLNYSLFNKIISIPKIKIKVTQKLKEAWIIYLFRITLSRK